MSENKLEIRLPYSKSLKAQATRKFDTFAMLGNAEILDSAFVGFMSHSKCTGNEIVKSLELACEFRKRGIVVACSANTTLDHHFLALLSKGNQPIIKLVSSKKDFENLSSDEMRLLKANNLLLIAPNTINPDLSFSSFFEFSDLIVFAGASELSMVPNAIKDIPIYSFEKSKFTNLLKSSSENSAKRLHSELKGITNDH